MNKPYTFNIRIVAVGALVLFAGLGLRLFDVHDRALWFDEGASVKIASTGNWTGWTSDVHPPLYYIILYYWMQLGDSDFVLRMLSVILGSLNIALVYVIGRQLLSSKAAAWSTLLFATYAAHVWYSQEVRMYSLLMFMYTSAMLGFVMIAKSPFKKAGVALFTLCGASILYLQGLGPLYTGTLSISWLIWILTRRSYSELRYWLIANFLIAAIFAPWAIQYLSRVQEVTAPEYGLSNWIERPSAWQLVIEPFRQTVLGIPAPSKLLHIASQHPWFSILFGKWWWTFPLTATLAAGIYTAFILRRDVAVMLATMFVLPLVGAFVASILLQPVFIVRNLLVISLPLVLFAGMACETRSISDPFRISLLLACLLTFALGTIYMHRYGPSFAVHNEGWELAAKSLAASSNEGDILLINMDSPKTAPFLLKRYDSSGRISRMKILFLYDRPERCESRAVCLSVIFRDMASNRKIWIVTAHAQALPSDYNQYKSWLMNHMDIESTMQYRAVTITEARWNPHN